MELSPLWKKSVQPLDDGFIPYVPQSTYQYNPHVYPLYTQQLPGSYDSPRTTRAVTLKENTKPSRKTVVPRQKTYPKWSRDPPQPMGPDIRYHNVLDTKRGARSSLPMGPDIPVKGYGSKSGTTQRPMGPDIRFKGYRHVNKNIPKPMNWNKKKPGLAMGPDIRYRPTVYRPPPEVKKVPMGPDIPSTILNTVKSNKPRRRTLRPDKASKKTQPQQAVQIRSEDVVYEGQPIVVPMYQSTDDQRNDDWKKPYEAYRQDANPNGARESIRRTMGLHGGDF